MSDKMLARVMSVFLFLGVCVVAGGVGLAAAGLSFPCQHSDSIACILR
jgi:hypothetical protein